MARPSSKRRSPSCAATSRVIVERSLAAPSADPVGPAAPTQRRRQAPGRPRVAGSLPAAASSTRNRRPVTPTNPRCRHLEGPGPLGQGHPHRAGLLGPGGEDPRLAGRVEGRQGQRHAHRRRLRRAAHGGDRSRVVDRRLLREQRGDMGVRPDAQQQDVHRRNRAVVLGACRGREGGGVLGGRLVDVGRRAPWAGDRMHPARAHRDVGEQCSAGAGLVAVGRALREVALVAPPEVDARPIDRVAGRHGGHGREDRGADAPAGEADMGTAGVGQPLDQGRHEPRRRRLGQRRGIGMAHDVDPAHGAPTCEMTSP